MCTEKPIGQIFIKPQKNDLITTGFKVYRGDSRDPYQGPLKYGFSVGDIKYQEENSRIACKALNAFNKSGLENFCWRWKNKGHLTVADAIKSKYFKEGSTFEPKEWHHELIQISNFMQGISTDIKEPNYGNNSYEISIPRPTKDGFKCIESSGSPFRGGIFYGKVKKNNQSDIEDETNLREVYFTVITTPQSCEIDFFTNIPCEWITKL